ncbi:MAG: leucine--tRNA ligase [Deltaproteobacteria bacterium]|nr:MAG: leucine--tRNA ligase [Deltaproteobacteria bacterium]
MSEHNDAQERYNFSAIEEKWQRHWEATEAYKVSEEGSREKYYVLEMFPYPSGKIHMGHVRNYTIGDVIARYKTMRGYNVLHPMGWDAFGLPAENAAKKHDTEPASWTYANIEYMRQQLYKLGLSYDWSREIATCNPQYYEWEQRLFLEMFRKGIVYQKLTSVSWCDDCQTVLANEQVVDGACWRCDQLISQRKMNGWFFKITDYAEELLEDLEKLKGWPENVILMQKNWIGKSRGLTCHFNLEDGEESISIFTTRPDTIYGVTFVSLAPEHPLIEALIKDAENREEIQTFITSILEERQRQSHGQEPEKKGIFTGKYCINPFTQTPVPIYIANFVLMEYGTGAVMAVPAHDERDFDFAKKYKLPIVPVVIPEETRLDAATMEEASSELGVLQNSGPFTGMQSKEAQQAIIAHAKQHGFGSGSITYKLRDWGISRQRYWGAPIPIIHCGTCGPQPVPDQELPVVLPREHDKDAVCAPLHQREGFIKTTCPQCGNAASRETDTMDTFVESSWYFARFTSPRYDKGIFSPEGSSYWLPVDEYIGGVEHAILHLLYARFFTKVLRDLGYLEIDEPFANLLTQGMVTKDKIKMSKSKGNVEDPDDLIERFGADTVRLFSLFAAPPEKDLEWDPNGVEGASRFLNRVYRLMTSNKELFSSAATVPKDLSPAGRDVQRKVHQTIKRVTDNIENNYHFNTAISAMMELSNTLSAALEKEEQLEPGVASSAAKVLLRLLSPIVPHVAAELWQILGHGNEIHLEAWPDYDPEAAKEELLTLVVQVNGKVRSRLQVPAEISGDEIEQLAHTDPLVLRFIGDKPIKKTIVIQKKLVNIVV